jgi:hypothetical protein
MKSLLYRLTGRGGFPAELKAALTREGIRLIDEGVKASVTRINYRDPRRRCSWSRRWFTGSVALTATRLVVLGASRPLVNLPLTDSRRAQLRVGIEGDECLVIAFDVALFHADCSGTVEVRLRTPLAGRFLAELRVG